MMVKKILAVIVALLVLAGGWFYFFFMKTPLFSLGMAGYAFYKKDLPAFEQYVDIDAIVNNGYSTLSPIYLGKAKKGIEGAVIKMVSKLATKNIFGKVVAQKAVESTKKIDPAINKKLKAEVRKTLQQLFAAQTTTAGKSGGQQSSSGSKLKFKSVEELKREGTVASMLVVLQNGLQENLPVQLKMTNSHNDRWKVVAVENLQYIVANAQKFMQ